MSVAEEKSSSKIFLGQDNNSLVILFAINAIVFIILKFIFVIYQMSEMDLVGFDNTLFNWLVLPADIPKLGTRPWTFVTHLFTHRDLFSLFPNMFWLWVFGYVLQDLTGNKKLIPLYLYGGLVGAAFYILTYYLVPKLEAGIPTATLVNANAAIMSVAIATTTVKPDYRFFPLINGGIPLWVVTLVFVIVDMASVPGADPGKYIAHLGGGLFGFVFIYQMRKGRDWSVGMNQFFDWCNNLFNPDKKSREKQARDEFFYKVHGTHPYKRIPNVTQKRIDEILDKMGKDGEGYYLLTDEEKDILRRASKEGDL
jgi:membrane associated rhomboid family serine protease